MAKIKLTKMHKAVIMSCAHWENGAFAFNEIREDDDRSCDRFEEIQKLSLDAMGKFTQRHAIHVVNDLINCPYLMILAKKFVKATFKIHSIDYVPVICLGENWRYLPSILIEI